MKSSRRSERSGRTKKAAARVDAPPVPLARWAALIGLATFLLYLPTLWSGFVYDAQSQIQNDRYIHTPAHFADVLTFRVLGQDVLDQNRPVQLLSLMLDALIWGEKPFGFHLTSNLLHALNAALVFLLIAKLLPIEPRRPDSARVLSLAALGALFFAFQPVMTEAVAEVSSREDSLATFFLISGLHLAIFFPGTTRIQTWSIGAGIVLAMLLAAGTKETGYAGPALLGIYWLAYRRTEPRQRWLTLLLSSGIVVVIFIWARFTFQPEISKIFLQRPLYLGGSLGKAITLEPQLWARLWLNIVWPANLSADYIPQNVFWISRPVAIVTVVIVLATQIFLSVKSRLALLGTAIFWLGLLPVSNFIPIYRVLADRFLYLPLVGFVLILCAALAFTRPPQLFATLFALIAIAVVAFGPLCWQRQFIFSSPLALWSETVAVSPGSDTANDNLGYALYESGQYQKALDSFQKAISLTQGKSADAWAGAALTFEKLGNTERADYAFSQAIAANKGYAYPHSLVASLLVDRRHADRLEAIASRVRASSPAP